MLWEPESGQRSCFCCSLEERRLHQGAERQLIDLTMFGFLVHFLLQGQYTGLVTSWGASLWSFIKSLEGVEYCAWAKAVAGAGA